MKNPLKNCVLFFLILATFLLSGCDLLEVFGLDFKKNWDYAYAENYVDSLDAVISNEGYVALFGYYEIPTSQNANSLERIMYVVKTDNKSGVIDESDMTLVVLDTLNIPTQIISPNGILRLSQGENGTLNCLYKLTDQDDWSEIENINYDLEQGQSSSSTASPKPIRLSMATGGVSNFTIANALKALDVVNGLKGCLESKSMRECLSNGLGVFGNFIPNDEASLVSGMVGAGLTKSLSSGLLSILSYTADKIADGPLKYLGPVRLAIEDVKVINNHSCQITYTVSGLHEYGMANSKLYFELYKGQRYIDKLYVPSVNGTYTKTLTTLEPAKYGVVLHIKTNKYHWEYTTYPTVYFTIYGLEVDRYEIDSDQKYTDRSVSFDLDVYLKGEEESLKECSEYGYYISFANDIKYYKVSQLSSIFSSTPAHTTLNIERDGFDKVDYNSFTAEATGYKIGAYAVSKNRNTILHFGEKELNGLIYTRKPSFKINNITVTERGSLDDESAYDSYISYSWSYSTDGWLFFKDIYEQYNENWVESGYKYMLISDGNDGTSHEATGYVYYTSGNTDISPISFYAELTNGTIHPFNSGFYFQNGSLYITSNKVNARAINCNASNNPNKPKISH